MKRSMIGFAITLVMAFGISSCGKSNGSGSSSTGIGTSLLTSGNLDASSTSAVNSFNTWLAGTETITQYQACGVFNVVRSVNSASSQNSNCNNGTFLGFINYQYCSSGGTTATGTPQPAVETIVNCYGTVRSAYSSMQSIIGAGTIVAAQANGNVYNLTVQRANGTTALYVVDGNYPAAFQPMVVIENSTSQVSTLTGIQFLRAQ